MGESPALATRKDREQEHGPTLPACSHPHPNPAVPVYRDSVGHCSLPQAWVLAPVRWAHCQCGKATGKEEKGFSFR